MIEDKGSFSFLCMWIFSFPKISYKGDQPFSGGQMDKGRIFFPQNPKNSFQLFSKTWQRFKEI